jgi:hypothetical protein
VSLGGFVIPTGELIGPPLLAGLKADGCDGIRQVAKQCPPSKAWALANEILDAGMQPYLSITFAEQMIALPARGGVLVGFENEPELNGISAWSYLQRFAPAVSLAQVMGLRIYGPEIANLNPKGFEFLSKLPWKDWPVDVVGCSFHRYPENSGFATPHKGCASRAEEVEKLRAIVGRDRPLLVGEVGYNNVDFTEQQSADYLGEERRFWAAQGVDWVFAYQLLDGIPGTDNRLDHYGVQTAAGREKPAKAAFLRPF